MKGICQISHIPVRSGPSHRTEMVSQLLFGETYEVLFENKGWYQIRIDSDQYEGWIDVPAFTSFENQVISEPVPMVEDLISWIVLESGGSGTPIVMGSSLPGLADNLINLNGKLMEFAGKSKLPPSILNPEQLKSTSLKYLNSPYLWGGRSPFGIDCSGFVQMVYKINGLNLPRDASQQAMLGDDVSFVEESKVGDLFFFENAEGHISHVGLNLGNGKIIHASGKVRIDIIDHYGIYNADIQGYSHKLRLIKRYF